MTIQIGLYIVFHAKFLINISHIIVKQDVYRQRNVARVQPKETVKALRCGIQCRGRVTLIKMDGVHSLLTE